MSRLSNRWGNQPRFGTRFFGAGTRGSALLAALGSLSYFRPSGSHSQLMHWTISVLSLSRAVLGSTFGFSLLQHAFFLTPGTATGSHCPVLLGVQATCFFSL